MITSGTFLFLEALMVAAIQHSHLQCGDETLHCLHQKTRKLRVLFLRGELFDTVRRGHPSI